MEDQNQTQPSMKPAQPKTWLVESILATILCCLPFGIAGIVYASKVEGKYNQGDYEGAERASKEAKKWTMVAAICGLAVVLIYVIAIVFFGFSAYQSGEFDPNAF